MSKRFTIPKKQRKIVKKRLVGGIKIFLKNKKNKSDTIVVNNMHILPHSKEL